MHLHSSFQNTEKTSKIIITNIKMRSIIKNMSVVKQIVMWSIESRRLTKGKSLTSLIVCSVTSCVSGYPTDIKR